MARGIVAKDLSNRRTCSFSLVLGRFIAILKKGTTNQKNVPPSSKKWGVADRNKIFILMPENAIFSNYFKKIHVFIFARFHPGHMSRAFFERCPTELDRQTNKDEFMVNKPQLLGDIFVS